MYAVINIRFSSLTCWWMMQGVDSAQYAKKILTLLAAGDGRVHAEIPEESDSHAL